MEKKTISVKYLLLPWYIQIDLLTPSSFYVPNHLMMDPNVTFHYDD